MYLPIGVDYQHGACKASILSAHLVVRMFHLPDFGMQRTVPVRIQERSRPAYQVQRMAKHVRPRQSKKQCSTCKYFLGLMFSASGI